MNKKQIASHVEAMMWASGLNPDMEGDYFATNEGAAIGRLLISINCFFELEGCHELDLHNLQFTDSPSEFIAHMQNNSGRFNR